MTAFLQIDHQAHGAKSNDPVVNLESEIFLDDPEKSLRSFGVQNETELSVFKKEDYEKYKKNPTVQW